MTTRSRWAPRPQNYHQGALLRLALAERGNKARPLIDHMNGRCKVGDVELGIVYPDSWFFRTKAYVTQPKNVRFLFIGATPPRRMLMLSLFDDSHPGTMLISTDAGRDEAMKGEWDQTYYDRMGRAQFGLCPHHPGWPGPRDTLWTYRFIECCMVGAIPVQFRATPLAESFTDGFRYRWDDEAVYEYDPQAAAHNRALAETRWRLP